MMVRKRGSLAVLASLVLAGLPAVTIGQANPAIPFYGYGAIVANPAYPVVGETAVITVTVSNTGSAPATNVQVKLSFNDWGVTFMGWQEIGTQTIPSIPAGGTATATFNYAFQNRAHTCLEALIVGADENADPNDDRGQINLEVIGAGETFSYGVPIRNEGDVPLDILVKGHCERDGTVPDNGCRPIEEVIHLEPGEERMVYVELDLRGFADGSVRQYQIDAFDLANPGSPFGHQHVRLVIVKTQPLAEKRYYYDTLSALAPSLPRGVAKRYRNALEHLEKALNPRLWIDGSHLKREGGEQVFDAEGFFDIVMTKLLPELPSAVRIQVAGALRSLVDVDRALAETARSQAPANRLPAVQRHMAAGDAARRAGEYSEAIHHYKKAWQAATR